jgi:hypothetical protein
MLYWHALKVGVTRKFPSTAQSRPQDIANLPFPGREIYRVQSYSREPDGNFQNKLAKLEGRLYQEIRDTRKTSHR